MKLQFAVITLALATLNLSAAAAEKVTLSGVHNCCNSCVKALNKASDSVSGVTADIEEDKVTLSAATTADLQKGVNALVAAGYTGTSDNAAVKVIPGTGPDEKVNALTISGMHLCCGKCVKAADKAVTSVGGVKSHNATKGADSFKVEGDFNGKELMAALAKAGFTGHAAK